MKKQSYVPVAENISAAHSRIAHEYAGGIGSGVYYYKDSEHAHRRWEGRMFDKIFSSIFSEIQLPKSASFLDAGCGNGQWMEYFARKHGFSNFTAVDFSEPMLECARERMSSIPVAVEYIKSNLESLDSIESGSIDIIHMFGATEHLEHPDIVIQEFHRILRNNGHLIINCPIRFSMCYFSFVLFGLSPEYWGLKPTWRRKLDFKSKMAHYRSYSKRQLGHWLSGRFEIRQRHNGSFSYAASYPGLLYKFIPAVSFVLQDFYDFVCRIIFLNHPAGVYWLARKTP